MGQHQNHDRTNKRTVFTKNARFTVQRFAAAAGAGEKKPEKIATLAGYALLWNDLSDDRGGYKVRLLPGSAKFSDPTMALWHHNFASIIGNTQNGTLRIIPDDIGVKVEIDLPDTTTGRDTEELVENGYVQGMSFAMVDAPVFTMTSEGGQRVMNITSFTADEVTVTAIPSFTNTSIAVGEDDVPEGAGDPMQAASKKSSDFKDRSDHGWKVMKYTLALDAIGRDSAA